MVANRKMGKKTKKRHPRTQVKVKNKNTTTSNIFIKIRKTLAWLTAIGILPVIGNYAFDFFTGDVQVKYIKPLGRGYEFKLINNSSTDQIIEKFRIYPDFNQDILFKISKPIYGEISGDTVYLPGGNPTYMPAFEYNEMNGYVLSAKSEVSFRIPPLAAREYMTPEAIIVYADYRTRSKNKIMRNIEHIFDILEIKDTNVRQKYLVGDSYWTPLAQGNEVNAIKNACRDDDEFSKSDICKEQL